jgi:ATP-dependent DNA helicase RecG
MEALGTARKQAGHPRPTVAGILLFGTALALRKFFPMMRIDYIRIPGVEWVKDPDRRFDTVEIRSPLLRAVQRARSAILDDIPKAFSLPAGEQQGREIPLLPERVIREVVANAVMHRSYRVHGSIQIIRYSNRLEIRNPGYSLKAEERLGQPGSETRNPKIAAVFHDIKFAETKGSGIRVMRELMSDCDLSPPVLQSDRAGNSFLAILLFHHFLSSEDLDWLATFKECNLTGEDCKALVSAREVGAIDNRSYRDVNRGVDTLTASKHLKRLCDLELLRKKGGGNTTYYVPTAKLLNPWNAIQQRLARGEPTDPGRNPGELPAKSGELPAKSGELLAKSGELPAKPSESTDEQGKSAVATLPATLQEEVERLGRKAKAADLRAVVRKLCGWSDLSLARIAEIVGRGEEYLRATIIKPMLETGELTFTIPDEPNHPRQTYRTPKKPDENPTPT